MNSKVIGYGPDGRPIHVSIESILQYGEERLRFELVDKQYINLGRIPPGYYPVRTSLNQDCFVLVKANSHEEAVNKYFEGMK